jgi:hypothetical protein
MFQAFAIFLIVCYICDKLDRAGTNSVSPATLGQSAKELLKLL